jgi:hypothetical protein
VLIALAVQFPLSFGHFHGVAAQAAPAIQYGKASEVSHSIGVLTPDAASQAAQRQKPSSNHDSDQQPRDICAICAVMAMANAVLFATPPALPLPKAVAFLYLVADAEFTHINSIRVAFQPRAPPIA